MKNNIVFQIYYPKSKYSLLVSVVLLELFQKINNIEGVIGFMCWADNYKGENFTIHIKGSDELDVNTIKSLLKKELLYFLKMQPATRENKKADDYLFPDYATNSLVFDDENDIIDLCRESKPEMIHISECLTKDTAAMSLAIFRIIASKPDWNMTAKLTTVVRLSYQLISNFKEELLISTFIPWLLDTQLIYFGTNPASENFQTVFTNANKMYDTIKHELEKLISEELTKEEKEWVEQAITCATNYSNQQSNLYTLVRHLIIQLQLMIGLGPDTGTIPLVWLNRFRIENNFTVGENKTIEHAG